MFRKILFSTPDLDLVPSLGALVLRFAAGFTMLTSHGWGKLTTFAEKSESFPDPLGVGPQASLALVVFAEFLCALLVAIGFMTRLAAIPLIITMAVAALIIHADDPFARKELPLMFMAMFSAVLLLGAGKFSVDARLNKN